MIFSNNFFSTDLFLQVLKNDKQYRDHKHAKYNTRKHSADCTCADRAVAVCRCTACTHQWDEANDECEGCHQNRAKPQARCFECCCEQRHASPSALHSILNNKDG